MSDLLTLDKVQEARVAVHIYIYESCVAKSVEHALGIRASGAGLFGDKGTWSKQLS